VPRPTEPDRAAPVVARLRAAGCVFAEDEAALLLTEAMDDAELERMVAERCSGTPLEHVLGWADFAGVRVRVTPGVFVPRPRSELLVDCAADLVHPGDIIIDLCCGSGAVALAVAARVTGLTLHACDVDPAAVACARGNLEPLGGHVHVGDLDAALPPALHHRARLMVANAPYVPTHAIPLLPHEARDHEPMVALDGGPDGLDLHRRIAALAPLWLMPGGHLLIETSEDQAAATGGLVAAAGFTVWLVRSDEHDATVVVGTMPTDTTPHRSRDAVQTPPSNAGSPTPPLATP
jgi:release factor glutamine methyltransferase